jgi:hypothetical protein
MGSQSPGRSDLGGISHQCLIDCSCGKKLPVTMAQAGSNITCECGGEVRVPSLSQLRELSGSAPYESSVADTIQGMIERGELPEGEVCALSGEPTQDVLHIWIVVPKAFEQRERFATFLLWSVWAPLFSGAVAASIASFFSGLFARTVPVEQPIHEHHSARTVFAPLRVASRHHSSVRSMSQRRLISLLRTEPIYARLLDENPIVQVSVRHPSS